MEEYMKEVGLLHRTDGPALAMLQKTAHVQRCRQVEELKKELERIKRRVSLVMDDYERESKPVQAVLCRANVEFMDDLNELKEALLDSIKRQTYQKQVTIFIVGYQEACGERHLILSHLNEFFSKHIGFFMSEEEQLTELEFEFDEVSERVDEALNSAEHATQHLAELNQEIINYMNTAVLNKDNKKKKRKLEKALNQAKEEIQKITAKLVSTHSDLEEKELKMKELIKLNEVKNLECMHFRSQVEITKRNVERIQQELKSQKILLEQQSKELEHLRKQLQEAHEKEKLLPCDASIALESQNQEEPLCEQQDELKGHGIDRRNSDASMPMYLREPCYPMEALYPLLPVPPFHGECDEGEAKQLSQEGKMNSSLLMTDEIQSALPEDTERTMDEEKCKSSDSNSQASLLNGSQLLNNLGNMADSGVSFGSGNLRGCHKKPVKLEEEREELNMNYTNSSKLSVNESYGHLNTRNSIAFSHTNAENRELSELPAPASTGRFHCIRVNSPETVQEAFLEHSIDLRDEETLSNSHSEAIAAQFAVYRKEAAAKISELQNEITIMRENYDQNLRFLQDQLNKKISDWKLRSLDEIEASVHSLADDVSVQSTHAVKSHTVEVDDYAKLDTLIEEQTRPVLPDSQSALNKQEDQKQELFTRSCSSQMADQDCDQYDRTKRPLMGPDTSVNLRPTSELFTIHLLTEEYVKMYMKVIEFKDSMIKKVLRKGKCCATFGNTLQLVEALQLPPHP
ncbi:coiled-coil domain-containing protein 186-like [Heterodontus francisci]|uniref:coiled-coil domain-containing protein 186-like n=1 Tax=Heterodontus francisci TaxID=7792 RepID=UPI00355C5849